MSYVPISHPFVERLIGTIRCEYLDRTLFCNSTNLHRKLDKFRTYCNEVRVYRSLDGHTPVNRAGSPTSSKASRARYVRERHCNGLFESLSPLELEFAPVTLFLTPGKLGLAS
jgi:hypothetical protein